MKLDEKLFKVDKEFIQNLILFLSLVLLMTFMGFYSFNVKHRDLDMYPSLRNDTASMEMHIKGIQENGLRGLYFNPRIGAPDAGTTFADASGVDIMLGLMIWILNFLYHPNTARLFYYTAVFSFVLTALSMAYVLKKAKINPLIIFISSSLFSLAPYHYYRTVLHLAIGNAFTVPFAILIVLYLVDYIKIEKKKDILETILCGLMLGLGCAYFTFFGFILFAVAIVFEGVYEGNLKFLKDRGWVLLAPVFGFFLSRLPSLVFTMQNGKNLEAFQRFASEQEKYGLKLIQLLLPVSYSKIPAFSNITKKYMNSGVVINENYMSSLGMVATIVFYIICGLFIYSIIKKVQTNGTFDWKLIDFMAFLVLTLILIGSIGGFGEIFNMFVTPQMRCYNRISIVITCICFWVMAYLLNFFWCKNKIKVGVFSVVIFAIGLFDQVTMFPIDNNIFMQGMCEDYFGAIQEIADEDAMIYELPYMDFPEAGLVNDLQDSELFMGYLFTDDIRWSYGGMRGRNVAAKKLFFDEGMSLLFVKNILDAGFSGVYIDTKGYEDGGEKIIDFYSHDLGLQPLISDNNKLYYYDLNALDISIFEGDIISAECKESKMYRMVEKVLDRMEEQKSEEEIGIVVSKLLSRNLDGYDTLWQWMNKASISDENTNNDIYIKWLYKNILGREAEQNEIIFWEYKIENESVSRKDIMIFFLESKEFRDDLKEGQGESEE